MSWFSGALLDVADWTDDARRQADTEADEGARAVSGAVIDVGLAQAGLWTDSLGTA